MKSKVLLKWLKISIGVFLLVLPACSPTGSAEKSTPSPQPTIFNDLRLKISPDTQLVHPIAVKKGAMIHIAAEGFTPNEILHIYLSSPGTEYKDPVASSKLNDEGRTTAIFAIPKNWDDGNPVAQNELLIIAEGGAGKSVTLKIGYINE
jgi:hypothetical protein